MPASSLFHSLVGLANFRSPLLGNILPCSAAALAIQVAVGVPSTFVASPPTERFYDLSGSLTFLAVTALSLYLPKWQAAEAEGSSSSSSSPPRPFHWRQLALSGSVAIWAIRLGSFLFLRVLREGEDKRFRAFRQRPAEFFVLWLAQCIWVILCILPVVAVNAAPPAALPAKVRPTDIVGFVLFVVGLAVEVTADRQKSQWLVDRAAKRHSEEFMTRGLWTRSQYPNYFGETTLWTGLATVAAGVLTTAPVRSALGIHPMSALALPLASPAFTAYVLLRLSGVPLSERKYDRLYGDRTDYQKWKTRTPKFFPKLF